MKFLSMLGLYIDKFKDTDFNWINDVFKYLDPILYAVMGVVAAAGAIYAIILGINLARADDQSKRDEAKKRLITTLIAVAVTVGLVLFFTLVMPMILDAFIKVRPEDLPGHKSVELYINMAKALIGR